MLHQRCTTCHEYPMSLWYAVESCLAPSQPPNDYRPSKRRSVRQWFSAYYQSDLIGITGRVTTGAAFSVGNDPGSKEVFPEFLCRTRRIPSEPCVMISARGAGRRLCLILCVVVMVFCPGLQAPGHLWRELVGFTHDAGELNYKLCIGSQQLAVGQADKDSPGISHYL